MTDTNKTLTAVVDLQVKGTDKLKTGAIPAITTLGDKLGGLGNKLNSFALSNNQAFSGVTSNLAKMGSIVSGIGAVIAPFAAAVVAIAAGITALSINEDRFNAKLKIGAKYTKEQIELLRTQQKELANLAIPQDVVKSIQEYGSKLKISASETLELTKAVGKGLRADVLGIDPIKLAEATRAEMLKTGATAEVASARITEASYTLGIPFEILTDLITKSATSTKMGVADIVGALEVLKKQGLTPQEAAAELANLQQQMNAIQKDTLGQKTTERFKKQMQGSLKDVLGIIKDLRREERIAIFGDTKALELLIAQRDVVGSIADQYKDVTSIIDAQNDRIKASTDTLSGAWDRFYQVTKTRLKEIATFNMSWLITPLNKASDLLSGENHTNWRTEGEGKKAKKAESYINYLKAYSNNDLFSFKDLASSVGGMNLGSITNLIPTNLPNNPQTIIVNMQNSDFSNTNSTLLQQSVKTAIKESLNTNAKEVATR